MSRAIRDRLDPPANPWRSWRVTFYCFDLAIWNEPMTALAEIGVRQIARNYERDVIEVQF